ncbi:hypothetical protein FRC01_002001 [Tulasnella sp. 417]|nr:hypothetical protein FRC01_002001 [Tulasnella sp. 417]
MSPSPASRMSDNSEAHPMAVFSDDPAPDNLEAHPVPVNLEVRLMPANLEARPVPVNMEVCLVPVNLEARPILRNLAGEYDKRFGILGGIGFFGAAAAFGPAFQPNDRRAFNVLLAWSATCFTVGTVLAVALGAVAGVGPINEGRHVHKSLKALALFVAGFILAGIVFLGVALISFEPSGLY